MFGKKNKEKSYIDQAIENRMSSITMPADTAEDDADEIKNLKDLVEIKEKLEGPKSKLNVNTIFSGVVSIATIGIIVGYERLHVIATKAVGFVPKMFGK